MISKDAKIFEKESAVRARMIEYGKLFDELHIIIISRGKHDKEKISDNVTIFNVGIVRLAFIAHKNLKNIPRNIDLVTAQDPFETGYFAYKIARKLGTTLQLQVHTDIFSKYFTRNNFKNYIRVNIARWLLPKADCIRVVSKRIKDSLAELKIKNYESKTTIVPIFIDAQKIQDAQPTYFSKEFYPVRSHARDRIVSPEDHGMTTSNGVDFTVLWVGRLEKEKNCSLAIDVFSEFIKKVPRAGLVIIGDGSERKNIEKKVEELGIKDHVIFTGWKNDITRYYKSADVLLVTSWYEGYGMNMVEARIAGMSVIAPDVGVAREVGAYITGNDVSKIADTLTKLYNHELSKRDIYEYPYKNKDEYLKAFKKSFIECSKK